MANDDSPDRRRLHRRRRWNIGALVIGGLGTAFLLTATIRGYNDEVRSNYIQHHGVHIGATVVSVANASRTDIDDNPDTGITTIEVDRATVVVSFAPVHGITNATIDYRGQSELKPGATVAILVDDRDPSYAEVPGHPSLPSHGWVLLLILTVLVFGLVPVAILGFAIS